MGLIFRNDLHDEFGTWPIAYIPYGGPDFGEIRAVGNAVGDGDNSAYYQAWIAAGDRLAAEAAEAEIRGHRHSARETFLRASACYATAYHPIYGAPVDPRLVAAFGKQKDAFDRGLGLLDPPVRPLRIPFAGTTMPAYLIPASDRAHEVRPLLVLTNGYDATVTDMYFASAVAASRRGYHCLLFDGPGQGEMLYLQNVYLRADWETVVKAVIDFAVALPVVDSTRIALTGWNRRIPRAACRVWRAPPRCVHRGSGPVGHRGCVPRLCRQAGGIAGNIRQSRRARRGDARSPDGGHYQRSEFAVEACAARFLGARRRRPAGLLASNRGLHDERPCRRHHVPDVADTRGE